MTIEPGSRDVMYSGRRNEINRKYYEERKIKYSHEVWLSTSKAKHYSPEILLSHGYMGYFCIVPFPAENRRVFMFEHQDDRDKFFAMTQVKRKTRSDKKKNIEANQPQG